MESNDSQADPPEHKEVLPRITKKVALSKVLPSDRIPFPRQLDALKAYVAEFDANGGKPVSNIKAGEISKMAASTIVVTNAFFCEVGFLSRGDDGFTPSPESIAYLRAVNGLSPETANEKLRPLFEKQWFSQILIPRLRLRPMEVGEVVKVLGEEANAGLDHIPRLEMLIDFISYVGVIKKEGNQITLASPQSAPDAGKQDEIPDSEKPPKVPEGQCDLPIPLNARTGRSATLYFPTDLTPAEVGKLIAFITLSFDYDPPPKTPSHSGI